MFTYPDFSYSLPAVIFNINCYTNILAMCIPGLIQTGFKAYTPILQKKGFIHSSLWPCTVGHIVILKLKQRKKIKFSFNFKIKFGLKDTSWKDLLYWWNESCVHLSTSLLLRPKRPLKRNDFGDKRNLGKESPLSDLRGLPGGLDSVGLAIVVSDFSDCACAVVLTVDEAVDSTVWLVLVGVVVVCVFVQAKDTVGELMGMLSIAPSTAPYKPWLKISVRYITRIPILTDALRWNFSSVLSAEIYFCLKFFNRKRSIQYYKEDKSRSNNFPFFVNSCSSIFLNCNIKL